MVIRFRYLTALLLGMIGGAPCMVTAGTPAPLARLTFSCYALDLPPGRVLYRPQPGYAPVEVRFYRAGRSPRYEYHGPVPIRFFSDAAADSGGAGAHESVVAEAALPGDAREVLLLFMRNHETSPMRAPGAFKVLVIDDTASAFPSGRVVIFNASGRTLECVIDGRVRELAPGFGPSLDATNPMAVELHTRVRGQLYPGYRGRLILADRARCLMIILPPRHAGSPELEVRLIHDTPNEKMLPAM